MHILWGGGNNPDVNRALGNWCAAQIGLPRPFEDPFTTMGVFDGETLVAVMLYSGWQPEAGVIEIHGAGMTPRWLTRAVLWKMFEYPFVQLGCQTVVMRCDPDNRRLARMLKSYGFYGVRLPRLRGRDKDEILYVLHDDVWTNNGFHRENHVK